MVNPAGDIGIGGVTSNRVGGVRPGERCIKIIEISRYISRLVRPLRRNHLETVGINVDHVLIAGREIAFVGISAINLEEITASDGGFSGMLWLQCFNVHAVLASFYPLL